MNNNVNMEKKETAASAEKIDKIETFKDFGGIRLEDDILIIPGGSRFLGDKRTPITVEEVEEIMR